jgi:hypothetical protein
MVEEVVSVSGCFPIETSGLSPGLGAGRGIQIKTSTETLMHEGH